MEQLLFLDNSTSTIDIIGSSTDDNFSSDTERTDAIKFFYNEFYRAIKDLPECGDSTISFIEPVKEFEVKPFMDAPYLKLYWVPGNPIYGILDTGSFGVEANSKIMEILKRFVQTKPEQYCF